MARGNGEGTIVKRKDGRWMGAVTIGINPKTGNPKRKYIYGDTRKEVAREMTEIKHKLMTGTYIEPSNMKLSEWLDKWIEGRKSSLAFSTYSNYKTMIKNHLNPELGDIKLKNLKSYQIQQLLNDKFEDGKVNGEGGLSERTVEYIYQTLHVALEKAAEDLIPRNPCKSVDLPKDDEDFEKDKLHTWNKDQVNFFLNTAKNFRYYTIFYLALNTGMRRGELLGLKWEAVDLEDKRIEVNKQLARTDQGLIYKKVKTKSANRTIPITDNIVKYLTSYKIKQNENKLALGDSYKKNDLVGCTKIGSPIDPRNLIREFKEIIKKAGLPEIRFHDLRHTFASTYLEAGGDITVLQQILGHASITVTIDTYSHVTKDMLNNAANIMQTMYKTTKQIK